MPRAFDEAAHDIKNSDQRITVGPDNCKHIPILKIGGNGDLLFNRSFQGKHFVPDASRFFEFLSPGSSIHLLFDLCNQIRGAAPEKHDRFIDMIAVDLRVDIPATGRQAPFHLAMEAGARSGFKLSGAALSQFKGFVYGFESFADCLC